MLLIKFLRFLRGYIYFTACDGFPERFLNLCNQAGAAMWDITWHGNTMTGKTDRRGYKRMQPCAEPSGITLKAQKKVGLPFFLQTYRRRAGLLIGLALCIALLSVLSGMIWTVSVTGNKKVPAEDILRAMEQQGVTVGAWRSRLKPKEISTAVQRAFPDIAWLSLNLRGSTAVIELREILPQSQPESTAPQHIVAAKAGQIKIMEVYYGSREAGPNQAVPAGAILAGGIVQNADEGSRLVHAEAYVVARTSIACQAAAARREEAAQLTVAKTHYTLRFLRFRIPIGPKPKHLAASLTFNDAFIWSPTGREMPIALERTSYLSLTTQQRSKNDRQLRLTAAAAFFNQEYTVLRAAQVLRQDLEINLGESACNVLLRGSAYENIGLPKALE